MDGAPAFDEQNQRVRFRYAEIASWRVGGSSFPLQLDRASRAASKQQFTLLAPPIAQIHKQRGQVKLIFKWI
jgi:hypothetical protein